jgi:tRNA A37 threonylcarbamoyltransferase TsaD
MNEKYWIDNGAMINYAAFLEQVTISQRYRTDEIKSDWK